MPTANPQTLNIPRITLFLIIGIVIADKTRLSISPTYWAIALAAVCSVCWFIRHKDIFCSVMLLTATMLLGALLMSIDWQGKQHILPETPITYKAVVSNTPIDKGNHWSCDLTTYETAKEHRLKAYIYTKEELSLGDCIECCSRWNEPRDFLTNSHFSYATYLKRHGYTATTFISGYNLHKTDDGYHSIVLSIKKFREKLIDILRKPGSSQQSFAIVPAMVLGDRSALSSSIKNDYANAGASHVLALSGLHLGIIISILSYLLFFVGKKTETAIKLIFIWSFVLLTGMPVSLMRVALMFTIMSIVEAAGRQTHSFNTLFSAAFLILLFSPQSFYDVGFQLSFVAVAAIMLMNNVFHPSQLMGLILVPLAAQLGTLPLILFHFGQFPTYFLLTNILIPLFATAVISISILTIALAFIPPVLAFLQNILAITAIAMNNYTHIIASLPHSTIQNCYINLPQLFFAYMLLAAFCIPIMSLKQGEKQ